jgi:hypothetical protein
MDFGFQEMAILLADAEFLNDSLVAIGVVFLQVIQQAAAPADHHQQPTARCMILFVRFEMLRQLANTLAEDRDLHFGTAGIAVMRPVGIDNGLFLLSG